MKGPIPIGLCINITGSDLVTILITHWLLLVPSLRQLEEEQWHNLLFLADFYLKTSPSVLYIFELSNYLVEEASTSKWLIVPCETTYISIYVRLSLTCAEWPTSIGRFYCYAWATKYAELSCWRVDAYLLGEIEGLLSSLGCS